jgi:acyl-coenzyme A synthetase/AMP-(fatty) acid ligase
LTEQDIADYCRRVLPPAVPKSIEFVDEIPRTASGKIRHAIAGRFATLREHLSKNPQRIAGETAACAAQN